MVLLVGDRTVSQGQPYCLKHSQALQLAGFSSGLRGALCSHYLWEARGYVLDAQLQVLLGHNQAQGISVTSTHRHKDATVSATKLCTLNVQKNAVIIYLSKW